MTITRATLTDIIARVHTVPSLPEVVTQVCRLVNDSNSDAKQVNSIMVKDAAMASKMLRLVNSVYYGLNEPVHDLEQARHPRHRETLQAALNHLDQKLAELG